MSIMMTEGYSLDQFSFSIFISYNDTLGPNEPTLTCIPSRTEWSTSSRRSSRIPSCRTWSTATVQTSFMGSVSLADHSSVWS